MRDIWSEGTYVDLWTLNHLLCGFIMAGWLVMLGVPTWLNVSVATTLFFAWEIYERVHSMEEIRNQIGDLFADYSGYAIFFLASPSLDAQYKLVVILVTVSFILLEISGYLAASRRRHSKPAA